MTLKPMHGEPSKTGVRGMLQARTATLDRFLTEGYSRAYTEAAL
ncbi:MAG TPA: hypothetical protein VFT65_13660 [Candidatus Angelobacter sp.]|nr:hypothetical protein [Candidatus Angelobacter sp.]